MLLDFWISFFIVMLLERGSTTPIIEYDKGVRYEEYVIEHEISTIQAKNETFLIDINSSKYQFLTIANKFKGFLQFFSNQ